MANDPNNESANLEKAALAAFEPTNRQLMQAIVSQGRTLKGINSQLGKGSDRMDNLEKRLKPIEITHAKAMMIIGGASIVGPVIVTCLSWGLDMWLKIKGH